ncbi:MAG: LysM peptidoglycan-binding domain-containing protein [Methylobacter sp.]
MHLNFNRSVKFLLVLISLIATGCSTTSKTINDRPPDSAENDNSYVWHSLHPFGKQKHTVPAQYRGTVWERLVSLYSFPDIENERINRELNWYLRHPAYLARVQQRAEPYMHLILDEIEAKNLPGELALLPIVESAFLPEAYSKSDASGLWQFIPATGRLYGLQQNVWYDGRRDVYASTKAATSFLKHLGETFDGDWHLALASYNYGKGNVRKAIERNENQNLPTDYWSLDLPKETEDYVPRLLAIAKIFGNAEKYNVHLLPIPNRPYCELVDAKSQLDLNKAAELADTPLNEFLKLNPGFSQSTTAPQGPHHLLVPAEKAESFKQNLAQLPYHERVDMKRYYEETLAEVRRDELQAALSQQAKAKAKAKAKDDDDDDFAPAAGKSSGKQAANLATNYVHADMAAKLKGGQRVVNAKPAVPQLYVVKPGDTFWNVAQRFSVSVNDLAAWNKISPKGSLIAGQKLTIKAGAAQAVAAVAPSKPAMPSSAANVRSISYVVKQGDSLAQISRKFNVSIADLRKWNPSEAGNSLTPGKKLRVILNT